MLERRRRTTSPRSARSTGCTCRRSAGRSSRTCSPAKPRSRTSPDEVLELKYRLGQVLQSRLGDVDGRSRAYRDVIGAAPEHQADPRSARGPLRRGHQAGRGRRDPRAPLPLDAASGRSSSLVYEAQLCAHAGAARSGSPRTTGSRELSRREAASTLRSTLDVYIRALKEFPLDEKTPEKKRRASPRTVDGGWETLANAYADVLGAAHRSRGPEAPSAVASRSTFEDELGDVAKAEETYKYVLGIDANDVEALANLDRIYLSIESWPDLAQILEMRVQATADPLDLVDLYPRLGELYETRLNDLGNAIRAYRRHLRRPRQDARRRDRRARANLRAAGRVAGARRRLSSASSRTPRATQPRPRSARRSRTWPRTGSVSPTARDRDVEGRARSPRRGPRGAAALANLYDASSAVWRELVDILERQFDIASSDDDRVNILTRRARTIEREARSRRRGARRLEPRPRHRLRKPRRAARDRGHPAPAGRPERARGALHQIVDRRGRRSSMPTSSRRSSASSARRTAASSQQPFDAAEAWRSCSTSAPTSRRWTRSRRSIEPTRSGPTSSA